MLIVLHLQPYWMAQQMALNPAEWISKYADDLYGYAYSKSNSAQLAEDFVQETFLAALNSVQNFKGNSSERTWLFSILKNKIADHYRKASTRYEVRESTLGDEENQSFLANFFEKGGDWKKADKPRAWNGDEENLGQDPDFLSAMNKCVDKLPTNLLSVIRMKFLEEKESTEVCKELGLTSSNYWVIIHRAKILLRACIEKTWFKV